MDIQNFETAYLNAGGKSSELEKEDGEYVSSKSQMGWQMWQAANASSVPKWLEIGRLQNRITELLDERQNLYAQLDAGTTEGFVLVPKKATKKMLDAGYEAHDGFFSNGAVQDVYVAMIEAQEQSHECQNP